MMTAKQCIERAFEANLAGEFERGDRWSALARNLLAAEERVLTTGDCRQIFLGQPIIVPADEPELECFLRSSWWC